MKVTDLEFVIENLTGSYKKFANTLEEYPILGVIYPTHYGYIKGYKSEDGHDLDVFIGNGNIFGAMIVNRDDAPNGIETKMLFGINNEELKAIKSKFEPVINDLLISSTIEEFFEQLALFKR